MTANETINNRELKVNLLLTAEGRHYNDGEGANQELLDTLTERMMPPSGRAATFKGEVVRAVNRLYHEYTCNGNDNFLQWSEPDYSNFDDEDSWEPDVEGVTPFCRGFLDIIECYFQGTAVEDEVASLLNSIERLIVNSPWVTGLYSNANFALYDRLCDYVTAYVAADDREQELPGWYKN